MDKKVSLVIPVMNEEESLDELLSQIHAAFKPSIKKYEIIFVDDGSTDATLTLLKDHAKRDKTIRIFAFRRNLGKSHALTLGFQKATGEYIATIDADLQDDPQNVVEHLEDLDLGDSDLIAGWRTNRKDTGFKKIASKFFNFLINYMFELRIHDLNCGLKVYRAECAKELKLYGGLHRFIPIIASELGFKVTEKAVHNRPRKFGVSKYKATKVFTDLPDLFTIFFITKYNTRPLHFFGRIGGASFLTGAVVLLYLSFLRLFMNQSIGTRPLLTFGVLMVIFGVQILMTGLLADLLVSTSIKQNTHYPLKYESEE